MPIGICHPKEDAVVLEPYEEYCGLYALLAQLSEHEDAQGHLKRALAQFFLTNNTLVSYAVGIPLVLVLGIRSGLGLSGLEIAFAVALVLCLSFSYRVAVIRFQVMAKCLWAARAARRAAEEMARPAS